MERTLAAFARSDAPPRERLAVVRELARAVAERHARGLAHGAIRPDAVLLVEGAPILPPARPDAGPLAGAGYDAPEVARGGRGSARADAFSLGAVAYLVLAGEEPFGAEDPLERVRRVLFVEPEPLRRRAPDVPEEVASAVAALLEKRRWRRGKAAGLVKAIEAAEMTATSATPTSTAVRPERSGAPAPRNRRAPPSWSVRAEPVEARTRRPSRTLSALRRARSAAAAPWGRAAPLLRQAGTRVPASLASLSPLRRAGLAALPVLALLLVLVPPRIEPSLEREIAGLLAQGDVAGARRRLEVAAKERPGDPLVGKLRGDVACARGAPAECVRRYRVALAARPELREDPVLRRNARQLLAREQPCGTRRSAAQLLGELRDPEALPALEAARRAGGIFAFLCTGDSIDRAITATRAELRRDRRSGVRGARAEALSRSP